MLKRLLAVLVVSLLAGCGGGGGGGDSSSGVGNPPGDLPASYTGSRSLAAITTSNARSVVTSAYSGTMVAGALDVLGKGADDAGGIDAPLLQEVLGILEQSATTATAPKSSAKIAEATVTETRSFNGYSGSCSYDVTVDTESGAASGTISFLNYSQNSSAVTVHGSFTFSGVFDREASRFTSLRMTITDIVLSKGTARLSMTGSLEASNSGGTKLHTMTVALTDTASGRIALLNEYTLRLQNSVLTCSGAYYDSVYGYVTISTPSPLSVTSISSVPTSGTLLVTGSNGTKARMTFGAGGSYTIEADLAGDGTFAVLP